MEDSIKFKFQLYEIENKWEVLNNYNTIQHLIYLRYLLYHSKRLLIENQPFELFSKSFLVFTFLQSQNQSRKLSLFLILNT